MLGLARPWGTKIDSSVAITSSRSWSSGYDRRLPSDGPGFNSRRTHVFSFLVNLVADFFNIIIS